MDEFFIMSRFSINYDDIWKEVDSKDFVNMAPSSEHDRDSVRRMAELIQEALQFLNNPGQLSQAQIQHLEGKVRQMEVKLARECELARRVDSTVPWYRGRGH